MLLPPDGTKVQATTYASIEYDRPPERVVGTLVTRRSPFDGPPQCLVAGVQVDPATVRILAGEASGTADRIDFP
jgi:hypothetical protein